MFCSNCGSTIPENSDFCPQCGNAVSGAQQQPIISDETMTVNRIRDNAKICAILWIVVGSLQVLSCFAILAGVWNIVMGIRTLKSLPAYVPGNRALFESYNNSLTTMIITAVINLFVGGIVPIALSVFEFFIRDQVLKNKSVFGA